MVVGNGCHAAFVLFARAVNVEIAEAYGLGSQSLFHAAAQHLVKQQFGIAVNVERGFIGGLFAEGFAFTVHGRAGCV